MKIIELIHVVEKIAQEYRPEAISSLKRNTHLHECKPSDIKNQDLIDAVLSDFINFLASKYGVDYGVHAYDIYWPEALEKHREIEALQKTDLKKYESESIGWEETRKQKKDN